MRAATVMSNGSDSPSVGEVIRELRLARGWTQKQLAIKAAVTERTISNLEREANPRPYGGTIEKVASALGIPAERLDTRRLAEAVAESATSDTKRDAISALLVLPDEDVAKILEIVRQFQRRRSRKGARR